MSPLVMEKRVSTRTDHDSTRRAAAHRSVTAGTDWLRPARIGCAGGGAAGCVVAAGRIAAARAVAAGRGAALHATVAAELRYRHDLLPPGLLHDEVQPAGERGGSATGR